MIVGAAVTLLGFICILRGILWDPCDTRLRGIQWIMFGLALFWAGILLLILNP